MRLHPRLAAYCGAAITALSAAAVLADQQIGNVVQRDFNGALGFRVASTTGDDLYFNRAVFAGETVKTPPTGSTVIRFQDRTQIQVGAGSSVVLDKFVYDPSSSTGDAAIKFSTGIFRFITGDIKNKDAVKLTTPTTSLTIRGTKFILAVAADGTTTLGVVEGVVDVTPCGNAQPVRENEGQAVRVSPACIATQVAIGTVPVDDATGADYAENDTGNRNPSEGGRPGGDGNGSRGNGGGSNGGGSSGGGSNVGGSSGCGSSGGGSGSGGSGSGGNGGGGFGGGGGHTDH